MWLLNLLKTSIGKKFLMSLTGLSFCGFLIVHFVGNLNLYRGKDAFNAYVEKLHSLQALITVAEYGLLGLFLIHVLTGMTLFYQNLKSRPVGYTLKKSAGGRTIGSMTMPYTGIALFCFIIFHLIDFHFVDHANTTVFEIVAKSFANPVFICIYIIGVTIAAIHVSHGFWSACQTLGIEHSKYNFFIKACSIGFSLIVAIGFGLIPIYMA